MSPIDHFAHGGLTPVLAYAMSSLGCMLGLLLSSRARLAEGRESAYWLIGAAVAIGGTGIWTMHFIAMMGFSVAGTVIQYDVPLTAASALLAIVVVGATCSWPTTAGSGWLFLLSGGVLAGCRRGLRCTTWAWPRCGCPRTCPTTRSRSPCPCSSPSPPPPRRSGSPVGSPGR
ncbi:MHYT domain-containing protein [Nonomuraea ferruginea]